MHSSTKAMAEHLGEELKKRNVDVAVYDIMTDLDKLLMDLVYAKSLVLASPTFFAGPHPAMVHAAYLINCLKPKAKNLAIIGSQEWGGRMAVQLKEMFKQYKPEYFEEVIAKGFPDENALEELNKLADAISEKHKVE